MFNRACSRRFAHIVFALSFVSLVAGAYPEGAPWGSANPDAAESCAACHYDYDPVYQSSALVITGLPEEYEPGMRYPFAISFEAVDAGVSGFQLLASAGTFGASSADIESVGAATRSTAVRRSDDGFNWSLWWQAPAEWHGEIIFYIAASSANDDQSPFGDTIHYRTSGTLPAGPEEQ